jgi:hypothetical protein
MPLKQLLLSTESTIKIAATSNHCTTYTENRILVGSNSGHIADAEAIFVIACAGDLYASRADL